MNNKFLFSVAAVLGALTLSSCGQTGPLPSFGKPIVSQWIKADVDGKKGDEYVATSNLQDIVFNDRGEVIGWYVKSYAGTPYITQKPDGSYDFSNLIKSTTIVNMLGQNGVTGANVDLFPVDRRAFVLKGGLLDPAKEATGSIPELKTDPVNHLQTAVFKYTQGGVTVTKSFTLHPKNFLIDLKTEIVGGEDKVGMVFTGLAKTTSPRIQAYQVGGSQPTVINGVGNVSVKNIQYAALQGSPSQLAYALVIKPTGNTVIDADLSGGNQSLITAKIPAVSEIQVYGGKNELIHLYQSKYTELPALFEPNIFGKISLLIVKLMEFLYSIIGNWGLVIIAMTIILRLVMWPLMQMQGRSSARMSAMQPLIKEIQDRYKGKADAESQRAMQAEMQQLYRDHNFNPAGCLTSFLPFPVLIALWSTVRNFEFDKGFLWMPDLATPDPFYILAVIYLLVNIANLYVMTRKNEEMFRQQAPIYIVFLWFALTFPAGVTIYTILSTLIGIGQQLLINKQVAQEAEALNLQKAGTIVKSGNSKPKKTLEAPKKD